MKKQEKHFMGLNKKTEDAQWIELTRDYVEATLSQAEAGHDFMHIQRVRNNALKIGESTTADPLVLELGAWLHDIADAKFHDGDESLGPLKAHQFLSDIGVPLHVIDQVVFIIRNISFRTGLDSQLHDLPIELAILQDADRLDAIGAIGIARAFSYGGHKGRSFYDPKVPPMMNMTKEQYKNSDAPTINHFYEKLLLLKELMNTDAARAIAEERHARMEQFLKDFFEEWSGESVDSFDWRQL
jgi:uncharacterized protein